MAAYYNEIDPYAAQWLRNLIAAGHIAPGDVDERSVLDVRPDDLAGYTQCHFFAGIGVWSLALRNAGWPDDRPVWTGSCPCQPFSSAGGRAGFTDERHLWPAWFHLIGVRRPEVIFGEQVASKDALAWDDLVQADMEGAGYARVAVDLCAAGVGAPHIRQRNFFVCERVADALRSGQPRPREMGRPGDTAPGAHREIGGTVDAGGGSGLADTAGPRPLSGAQPGIHRGEEGAGSRHGESERHGSGERLADAEREQRQRWWSGEAGGEPGAVERTERLRTAGPDGPATRPAYEFWSDADWLFCRDGKWRPVEPGTLPLAHGAPARVGRLRAYGNAIVEPVARTFIEAYLEAENCPLR